MTEALYERYKDALRRGHVAALRGRLGVAAEAYSKAASIAPDRPLPLVSLGGVLLRLGKPGEALSAYEVALERSPSDEGALRGRADALLGLGDRLAAATALDRLAAVLDAAGRLPDAADAARRALELVESRTRRAAMRDLVRRLAETSADPAAAEALARASSVLDDRVGVAEGPAVDAGERVPDTSQMIQPDEATPVDQPLSPPFLDPAQAGADVEDAVESGDAATARAAALVAATGHRAAGRPNAAIDICYQALAVAPADPDLHLALAELYLDQGWRSLAVDKLVLLADLTDLTGDPAARARVCGIVAERLADESRLTARCA